MDRGWRRVTKESRCPICGRPDWCLLAGARHDPTAAICARVESQKRCGDAGWLHHLRADHAWNKPRRRTIAVSTPAANVQDFEALANRYAATVHRRALDELSDELGVSATSLMHLGIGWSAEARAWTFPMRAPAGGITGIRLRLTNGRKLSVRGGKERLFIPDELSGDGPLLVAEGPTDTMAALDLGFDAIGRPSCTGGTRHVVDFVQLNNTKDVVVVADGDEPGRIGAGKLASVLAAYVETVKTILPPPGIKDLRAWRRAGATESVVAAAIDNAPAWPLVIRISRGGRAHV